MLRFSPSKSVGDGLVLDHEGWHMNSCRVLTVHTFVQIKEILKKHMPCQKLLTLGDYGDYATGHQVAQPQVSCSSGKSFCSYFS